MKEWEEGWIRRLSRRNLKGQRKGWDKRERKNQQGQGYF
jgi:hypothetical protein